MLSWLRLVEGGRRCMAMGVSMDWPMATLGWVSRNRTTVRVSGSDRGYSPAPTCVKPRPVASRPGSGLQFSG